MKLIETAIDESGESYIYKNENIQGWPFPGHVITDIFLSKNCPPDMMESSVTLDDKNFNLKPGEVRFFRTDMEPTHQTYETLKAEDPATPPFKKLFYHSTTTVDYIMILKGPVVMIVNDEEIELQTGDCVVQRGAGHTWHNYTNETVSFMGIMIGVEPPVQFKRIDTIQPE